MATHSAEQASATPLPVPRTPGSVDVRAPARMPVVHELSKDDCAWLLSTDRVGRLIYTAGALPAVAPVTYTIVDKDLLIHLEPDDDLMLSLLGRVVALQVDFVDRERLDGWQVTLTGKIHAETPGTSDRHTLRLVASIVSGRTVRLA